MKNLARVYQFKIAATVLFWCVPLILFPQQLLLSAGFPEYPSYMFVRMLGWAYLALCVGYYTGLRAALQGEKIMGPIYVGLVSNGGGCAYLLYYGLTGEWQNWGMTIQFVGWSSVLATLLITLGLYRFGIQDVSEKN
ncbi:MAG: hypothetical protein AseanaTS_03330 [Candidatus Pelagadaptatus aseana]|uniref:hypothetical protein n=1 Tax=Candidatus Pelagadaptatus aseana TaxID=3120508 RepID=UPI0039B2272A